jgi:hypothetical protein
VRRERGQHRVLDVDAVERPFRQRAYLSLDADRRRRAGDEEQVAATRARQDPQPGFKTTRVAAGGASALRPARSMELGDQLVDVVDAPILRQPFARNFRQSWYI